MCRTAPLCPLTQGLVSPSNLGNIDPRTGMGHPICSAGNGHPPAPLLPHADKPFSINYAVKQLPWRGCSNRRKVL